MVEPGSARIRLKVHQQLATMHPADLADILEDLGRVERREIVSALDPETAALALSEADPSVQTAVVEAMHVERAADVLEEMAPDEAADILGDLPEERLQAVLEAMEEEDADEVRGLLAFKEDSAAGQAHFHTTGPYGGYISFLDRSSSDLGTFVIDPDINNARIVFYGTATASNASFEVGAGADIQFFESSSAGNSTILLRGNGGGTSLGTFGGTAGSANITVMGAEFPGTVGANLSFAYPGTAENATITINGASVTTFGANGGLARFDYSSSAGKSAITVNGGSNGGAGGCSGDR